MAFRGESFPEGGTTVDGARALTEHLISAMRQKTISYRLAEKLFTPVRETVADQPMDDAAPDFDHLRCRLDVLASLIRQARVNSLVEAMGRLRHEPPSTANLAWQEERGAANDAMSTLG